MATTPTTTHNPATLTRLARRALGDLADTMRVRSDRGGARRGPSTTVYFPYSAGQGFDLADADQVFARMAAAGFVQYSPDAAHGFTIFHPTDQAA